MTTRQQWLAGSKLGDRSLLPGDLDHIDRLSRITKLVNENPKSGKSHDRFSLYRTGMTVAEYISAVVAQGEKERLALNDLCWDINRQFIRLEAQSKVWSVAEAKAKLSEILRLAREGEPQTIGTEEPCVVVSAAQFQQYFQPEHLGRFLVESAPRGYELELPSRADDRGDPFADTENGRAA
jgi:prevent-host-death family protein